MSVNCRTPETVAFRSPSSTLFYYQLNDLWLKDVIYPAKNRPAKTPTQTAAKPEIVVPAMYAPARAGFPS